MSSQLTQNTECCPPFDPKPWDEKTFEWKDKKFIKANVCTFFFMPVNFGKVMRKLDEKVRNAGANIPDYICLSEHTSKWNMNVYLAVDKDISDAENTTISGRFISKVYEGSFQNTGKWCKDFESYAKTKNSVIRKMFMWYTTCPKCAKKYGKNYVVILGQVE